VFRPLPAQLVMESLGNASIVLARWGAPRGLAVLRPTRAPPTSTLRGSQLRDEIDNSLSPSIEVLGDPRDSSRIDGDAPGELPRWLSAGKPRAALQLKGARTSQLSPHLALLSMPRALVPLLPVLSGPRWPLCRNWSTCNANDQPGVEAGKKAAATILDLYKAPDAKRCLPMAKSAAWIDQTALGLEEPGARIFLDPAHLLR